MAETLRFPLADHAEFELLTGGGDGLCLTYSDADCYVSVTLSAVHVRAICRYLLKALPGLEAEIRLQEDIDLANDPTSNTGELLQQPLPAPPEKRK